MLILEFVQVFRIGAKLMISVNSITSAELKKWQEAEKPFQLLDVRTQAEMEQAMIPGGKPLGLSDLLQELTQLPKDEDLVIYCRSGVRSHSVCDHLMKQGYNKVYNLSGGIIDWYKQGYDLTTLAAIAEQG